MQAALLRWPTGIVALWYPIKDPVAVHEALALDARFAGLEALALELLVRSPAASRDGLHGTGLVVLNPPWRLEADARILLPALGERLARAGWSDHRIVRSARDVAGNRREKAGG